MFQSTRPVRGATHPFVTSSSAPHRFNPRAPCGARHPASRCWYWPPWSFNPRAPCGARHHFPRQWLLPRKGFNPRAPCGARHVPSVSLSEQTANPTNSANPLLHALVLPHNSAQLPAKPLPPNDQSTPANLPANPRPLHVRGPHTINAPCGSYEGFAPTCSTRPLHLSPRK